MLEKILDARLAATPSVAVAALGDSESRGRLLAQLEMTLEHWKLEAQTGGNLVHFVLRLTAVPETLATVVCSWVLGEAFAVGEAEIEISGPGRGDRLRLCFELDQRRVGTWLRVHGEGKAPGPMHPDVRSGCLAVAEALVQCAGGRLRDQAAVAGASRRG